MKYIEEETQKRIMFIPFVNIANWFIWLYNSIALGLEVGEILKGYLYAFTYMLPGIIIWIVLVQIFPGAMQPIGLIAQYIIPLCMGWGLLRYQHKLFG